MSRDAEYPEPNAVSRRDFLKRAMLVSSAVAGYSAAQLSEAKAAEPGRCPIVVFSKVYQELGLNFNEAAEVSSEAGLDGIDSPVRPGGEIDPEQVTEELPRYAGILRERKLQIPLLSTGILSTATPHAEEVLRAARAAGVEYYRIGFIEREAGVSSEKQAREVRARLKDLTALNKAIGIGALIQNHSPAGNHTYFGGDLREIAAALEGLDPAQAGVAFDIGHALVVHGVEWRRYFELVKPHFRIAYVKDVAAGRRWVPFGQGDIAGTGYFKLLRQMGYHAPISMHMEYDWTDHGKNKSRAGLVKALKESRAVLEGWLADA